jgi:hypothetical protein
VYSIMRTIYFPVGEFIINYVPYRSTLLVNDVAYICSYPDDIYYHYLDACYHCCNLVSS